MEQMNKERCLTEGQGKKFDDKARKAPICLHNAAAGTNLEAIGTRCRRGRGRRGTETDTRGETGPRTNKVSASTRQTRDSNFCCSEQISCIFPEDLCRGGGAGPGSGAAVLKGQKGASALSPEQRLAWREAKIAAQERLALVAKVVWKEAKQRRRDAKRREREPQESQQGKEEEQQATPGASTASGEGGNGGAAPGRETTRLQTLAWLSRVGGGGVVEGAATGGETEVMLRAARARERRIERRRLRGSARRLQAAARGLLVRKRIRAARAVGRLQLAARAMLARAAVHRTAAHVHTRAVACEAAVREGAVIRLQAGGRQLLARRQAKARAAREEAVLRLQAGVWRMWRRKQARELWRMVEAEEPEWLREAAARLAVLRAAGEEVPEWRREATARLDTEPRPATPREESGIEDAGQRGAQASRHKASGGRQQRERRQRRQRWRLGGAAATQSFEAEMRAAHDESVAYAQSIRSEEERRLAAEVRRQEEEAEEARQLAMALKLSTEEDGINMYGFSAEMEEAFVELCKAVGVAPDDIFRPVRCSVSTGVEEEVIFRRGCRRAGIKLQSSTGEARRRAKLEKAKATAEAFMVEKIGPNWRRKVEERLESHRARYWSGEGASSGWPPTGGRLHSG